MAGRLNIAWSQRVSERAPYSRIYWSVRNDPRLVGIYSDDHHWATWARLLLAADMSWPAPADLPAYAKPASVKALQAAGIIELLPGGLFTFHGLDTERGRRAEAARVSSAHRSPPERGPNGTQSGPERLPSRDETSKDEQSMTREVPDGRKDLEAWMLVRGFHPPSPRQRAFLDGYVQTFDLTGPARAERLILANPDDPIAALKKDLDAFRAERRDAAVASEIPKVVPHRKAPGLTGVNAELAKMFNGQYAEEEKP